MIPERSLQARGELPNRTGAPQTLGKDRSELSKLRDRLACVPNGGYAPRDLEVDIHRWFFPDYVFRKRGQSLAKAWTGFSDRDFENGEPTTFWAYWHLADFSIPKYASDTDAALAFSHSCFVQGRLLSIHEVEDEFYQLWRVDVSNRSGEVSGSGQHAILAVAIMLAVLEAVVQHGTVWDQKLHGAD